MYGRFAASPFSFANISLIYFWIAVIVLFSIWIPGTFLTETTLKSLASEQAVTAIAALAAVVALSSGVFDLSIGALLGGTVILAAHLMVDLSWAPVPAAAVTLLFGLLVGCVTGTIVVFFRVNSFITTLGISAILTALIADISNNQQIIGLPISFQEWATFEFLGVEGAFWIMLVLAVAIWFVLECRPVGRYMYATGSNPEAARLAGVRVNRIVFGTAVFTALISSIAGIVVLSRVGTGSPTIGPPYLLPAFAAAFLGSTQLKGGRFNVLGTLIAVYALATSVKGLQLAGAPFWLPELFNGVALLIAPSSADEDEEDQMAMPNQPPLAAAREVGSGS
jgi:ribose transport system permease protein